MNQFRYTINREMLKEYNFMVDIEPPIECDEKYNDFIKGYYELWDQRGRPATIQYHAYLIYFIFLI